MLFHVSMEVKIPHDLAEDKVADIKAREKEFSQKLQKDGTWRHLWRVVGQYSNVSIFDVASSTELHELLTALPLYPFMKVQVTALCHHPSSIHESDR